MRNATVLALRAVLTAVLAGSLFVQVVMVTLLARDLAESSIADRKLPILAIIVLGILTVQVTALCVWRLLTMVRHGTVFSHTAFRYVNIVIGAISSASALTFALGVVLAPGEQVAPGVVLLIGGLAALIAGIALIVLVLRMLLAQAVDRDAEATGLQAELDEVI